MRQRGLGGDVRCCESGIHLGLCERENIQFAGRVRFYDFRVHVPLDASQVPRRTKPEGLAVVQRVGLRAQVKRRGGLPDVAVPLLPAAHAFRFASMHAGEL